MHGPGPELIKALALLLPMCFLTALFMVFFAVFGFVSWHMALPIIISAIIGGFLIFCATIPPHNGKK